MERYTASYLTEMKAFIQAVQGEREIPVNGEDGLKAALIAVAAQQSYKENRPIGIKEMIMFAATPKRCSTPTMSRVSKP